MKKLFSGIILSLLLVSLLGSPFMVGTSMESTGVNGKTQKSNSIQSLSGPPPVEWNKTYGTAGVETAWALVQTSDGGYALEGFGGSADTWLVKTDASGNMQWNKTYGGGGEDYARALVQTTDDGYALAGGTDSFGYGAGGWDFWLIKTDASGTMLWNKTYGGWNAEVAYALVQTTDGGYALAGYTDTFGAGNYDFWLVKTDASGTMQWNQTYGGTGGEWCNAMVQTSDGGYALAGYQTSLGFPVCWLVKTDAAGNMQWNNQYGGTTGQDEPYTLVQTTDGGFALAGITMSFGAGQGDFWLVKTDASGTMQWNQTYGGTNKEFASALVQTPDGGYALAGLTMSFGTGISDFWLVKTDSSGTMQWSQTYGGAGDDEANALVQTTDDGYALAGVTNSFGAGATDFWLVKLARAPAEPDWWTMFHHDAIHTGYSNSTAPTTNETLWSYKTGYAVLSSPAVANGITYVGSEDGKVYALNALTGALIWNYTIGSFVESSPAVADGFVYVGSRDWRVYVFNASTGALKWTLGTGGPVHSSPVVAGGIVYVGTSDGYVYAFNTSTGALKWRHMTDGAVFSSPAVAGGVVYVGSYDGKVYAFNAEWGWLIWTYLTGSAVFSSPAVVDGVVYVGSYDGKVYALNASTGASIWNYTTGIGVSSSPAVAGGVVYVGALDGKVYALNASTGASIWNYTTGIGVSSSPAVAGGVVYVGSYDGKVYALNASTGASIWNYTTGNWVNSSPAVAGGVVYVGSYDWKVYAFGVGGGARAYYSVEPVAIPKLKDIDDRPNVLVASSPPSPVGMSFNVEIHLRNATVDNVPYGVSGVEVHFYFGNMLKYCVPTRFTTYLGQTGGALNSPTTGVLEGFYAADGTLVTDPPYTGAVYYKVAKTSTGAGWNGADGLVATITFKITEQPSLKQPVLDDRVPAKMILANDFTALGSLGTEIPHGNIPGGLVIDNDHKTSIGKGEKGAPQGQKEPITTRVPDTEPTRGKEKQRSKESTLFEVTSNPDLTYTFNVTVYANTTVIGSENVTLLGEDSTVIELYWNTTDFEYGNYSITVSIFVYPVLNETVPENSTDEYAWVALTIPGDVNGDFHVTLVDLVLLANAYGSIPGNVRYDQNADINGNYVVDLTDLVLMAQHYGQHYP